MTVSGQRLGWGPMVAFGLGQAAEGIKNSAFNTFVLFFYQQVIGVPGALTGLALGIALCFDAITDPLAGALSDRTRSRWGRRHPWMLAATLPLAIAFYCLFNPPEGLSALGNFAWLTLFAVLVRGSLTFYAVPHLALGAELAPDYAQRSTLYAVSQFFGSVGGALTGFLAYRYFFPTTPEYNPGVLNPAGYVGFGMTFGIVMSLAIVGCVIGTAREIPRLRQTQTVAGTQFSLRDLFGELGAVFRNGSFRALFFGMLFSTLVLSIEGVFSPYMGVHFWGFATEQLALIPLVSLLGLFCSVAAMPVITRWFDKKGAVIYPAIIVIINTNILVVLRLLDVSWFPANGSPLILPLVMLTSFVTAMLAPVVFATINSMFADIADEHELESGHRREGVIFAARSFVIKSTGACGVFIGGLLLDVIAFPRGAAAGTVPPETVWWLGLLQGPATSIFTMLGLLLYIGYRLDRTRHAEIRAALAARQHSPQAD